MPKLGAYLSTLTNSRESCQETPFAPEQHVLWRALSRGTATSHEPRLFSWPGCVIFPPARKMRWIEYFVFSAAARSPKNVEIRSKASSECRQRRSS